MLNLIYITNQPKIAKIAERAGVDWIFVDMEWIGKNKRQGGLDTVQNHHTFEDIKKIKSAISSAKVLVRVNPIHEELNDYPSSEKEIKKTIKAGADIIMLPFFKTPEEVSRFIKYVDGKARTLLLVETKEAVENIDEILSFTGIDEIYIGLNDLHLSYNLDFMFQLLENGTVDMLAKKFKAKGIPFGFGGIAKIGGGLLPAEHIIAEHFRLGSTRGILSRSFCDCNKLNDLNNIATIFENGVSDIRVLEENLSTQNDNFFEKNRWFVKKSVQNIVNTIRSKK